jgi:hypothetical protein
MEEPRITKSGNSVEEQYRLQGIEAMKGQKYTEAYEIYTEALKRTQDAEYIMKFRLNLAIICYKLNLID